jgi:hypothetical protein
MIRLDKTKFPIIPKLKLHEEIKSTNISHRFHNRTLSMFNPLTCKLSETKCNINNNLTNFNS